MAMAEGRTLSLLRLIACGISTKKFDFIEFISDYSPDLVLLSESLLYK